MRYFYIDENVRWHVFILSIIFDRGAQFTSYLWRSFKNSLGTQVKISTTFYPQTDRKVQRTIHTLEYMWRACVIDFRGGWDDHLPLIEFTHNNSYHSNIVMAPLDALYGRMYRFLVG